MDQHSVIALGFGVWAFGFVCVVALCVGARWRWGLAVAIGIAAAIAVDVHFERDDWLAFARDAAIGALAAPAVLALLLLLLRLAARTRLAGFFAGLRDILLLRPPDGSPPPPLSDRDRVRRWFVVVAAALGSVVFTLMAQGEFWQALGESLRPARVFSALLVVGVAVVLVGPVQDFVLGRSLAGETGGHGEPFAALFAGRRPLRSALRLALVFALALTLLELISNSLDEAVAGSASLASFTIVVASIVPAIVTGYWCAALQARLPPRALMEEAASSSSAFFAVLNYVPAVAMVLVFGLHELGRAAGQDQRAPALMVLFSPIVGLLVAGVLGFLAAGIYALLGGWTLGRWRGWPSMALLLGALLVAALFNHVAAVPLAWLFADAPFDWSGLTDLLAGALGWWVGLLASGFPRIISAYRTA